MNVICFFLNDADESCSAMKNAKIVREGDAREIESSRARNINIGRLVRERFHIENIYDIGFTTYTGTVTAADN